MTEVVIFPEMIVAGKEALGEGRENGLDDAQICIVIYLAMEAIREMSQMPQETVH